MGTYTKEKYNTTYRGEAICRVLKDGVEIATGVRESNLRPLAFYDKGNHPAVVIHWQEKPMSLHRIKDAMTLWEKLAENDQNPSEYMIGFSDCALTGHFCTNLKKWVVRINHDGSLSLCHD